MAATLHRPPGHQGPVAGSSASCTDSESSSAQPDPGPHSAVHEPGLLSHPQPSVFVRPLVYVQAPPPPSFLHYQWPLPSFYNPFGGIPGYGMVLPPPTFLPPPYLEAPPYVLPHSQIPPVEYRRLPHQQGPSQGYHQHPNQTTRTRVPQTGPVRQTTNSEVQTEPTQRGGDDLGWLPPSSDSGRGTTPNSLDSSGSRSQKEASADLENFVASGSDAYGPPKDVFTNDSTGTGGIQTCIKATQEMEQGSDGQTCSHDCKHDQCNTTLNPIHDADPVCSSSQKDDGVCSERHTSVPDILLNWRGSTPKSVPEELLQKECLQTEPETNNSVARNSTDTDDCLAVVVCCNDADGIPSGRDSKIFSKIIRFPFFINPVDDKLENLAVSKGQSLTFGDELESSSQKLPDCQQNDCDETFAASDAIESILSKQCFSSYWTKRKMDESVWSVESLVPFIPNTEWLLQNGLFEPEVNKMEITHPASPAQSDCLIEVTKERWERSNKLFPSDFNPEILFDFKILNDKQNSSKMLKTQAEPHEMRPEPDQCTTFLEKDALSSPSSKATSTSDEDENGSSEPEAEKIPNQESFPVNGLQEDGPKSAEETMLLSSVAEEGISPSDQVAPQTGAATEVEETAEVSGGKKPEAVLSKGPLVDCGVQCDEFQDRMCVCLAQNTNLEPDQIQLLKRSEIQNFKNGKHESFCVDRNVHKKQKGQKRNKTQGHGCKPEACNGNQRSGKARGGNGRNLLH